jgi:hypothetical protein
LICHTGDIIAAIKIPNKLAQFTEYDFLFDILGKRQLIARLWYSLQSEIANLIFNDITNALSLTNLSNIVKVIILALVPWAAQQYLC